MVYGDRIDPAIECVIYCIFDSIQFNVQEIGYSEAMMNFRCSFNVAKVEHLSLVVINCSDWNLKGKNPNISNVIFVLFGVNIDGIWSDLK